jgi:hypothetical protein
MLGDIGDELKTACHGPPLAPTNRQSCAKAKKARCARGPIHSSTKEEALMSTHQADATGHTPVGGSYPVAGQATVQPAAPSKWVVALGYICSVLVPIVGFIYGAVLGIKYKGSATNPGTGIMVTAVAVFLISALLIASAGSA